MTLSRKDFFRRSVLSLGETLLKAGGSLQEMRSAIYSAPEPAVPECEPLSGENVVVRADNSHCLAKGCGCFSCEERCEAGAISVVVGVGIRIDEDLCTGCGTCHDICPITPKALSMVPRTEQLTG